MAKKTAPKTIKKSTVAIMKERAANRSKQIKKAKVNLKKASAVRAAALKKAAAKKAELAKLLGPKSYSTEDLKKFKTLILEKRLETMEELDTLRETIMDVTTGEYVTENSTYSLHMEQGTDAMEREKTFLFASRGNKFLNQLDDALTRVDNKTYGKCRICDLLIPKDRLLAVPTAQTCVEYKNTNLPCSRGKVAVEMKGEDE
ncbi:MAG TPA: TraR/DksA C4-type zinc finger protein [Bacteroidota bacterium]